MKEKRKLNIKRVIGVVEVIILVALISVIGVYAYNDFFGNKTDEPTNIVTEKNSIKEFNYKLEDRDTELYEKAFNELKVLLESKDEIDYEKYANLISKLFVIDFYTLSNKVTSTDIGALEFIHPNNLENFKLNAGNTMYNTVLSNLYNEREQVLPEVSEVTINSTNATKFKYGETENDAYEINLSWKYVEDLGYDTSKTLIVMKENNKLYVVSSK